MKEGIEIGSLWRRPSLLLLHVLLDLAEVDVGMLVDGLLLLLLLLLRLCSGWIPRLLLIDDQEELLLLVGLARLPLGRLAKVLELRRHGWPQVARHVVREHGGREEARRRMLAGRRAVDRAAGSEAGERTHVQHGRQLEVGAGRGQPEVAHLERRERGAAEQSRCCGWVERRAAVVAAAAAASCAVAHLLLHCFELETGLVDLKIHVLSELENR